MEGTRAKTKGTRLGRPSIGVFVEDRRVAVYVRPMIRIGESHFFAVEDCGDQSLQTVLARLLDPWLGRSRSKRDKRGPWVQLAIPTAQVFQATVPITQSNRTGTAQSFFLEAVQATNIRAEDRVIDLLRLELNKQQIACVGATPAGRISSLVSLVKDIGARVGLVEPAASSLFRAGMAKSRTSRGSVLCARFFLGSVQAVGVLGLGAQPLFWHEFVLEPGQETAAVLASYTTLWMLARNSRISAPIDTIVVHGRPDLALAQDGEEFRRRTGAEWIRSNSPGYDPEGISLGLALADPLSDSPRLDLGRNLKSPPDIRDIFPFTELILQGAMMGAVSLWMLGAAGEVGARLRAVEAGMSAFPWARQMEQGRLDEEKKRLEERIRAISSFRSTRVGWSVPLRTIAAAAPEDTVIRSLSGEAEVEATGRSAQKARKQLVVSFETPLDEDGSLPKKIDIFLNSLRGEPSLKRHFPLIEVTGLRANPARQGMEPSASYSVVCLPNPGKTASAAPKAR